MSDKHLENRDWLVAALCGEVFGPGGICGGWKNDLYGRAEPLATQEKLPSWHFDSWKEWNDFKRKRQVDALTGEEIIKDELPSNRYGVGILFPATAEDDAADANEKDNGMSEAASAEQGSIGLTSDESSEKEHDSRPPRRLTSLERKAARLLARRDIGTADDENTETEDLEDDDSQALSLSRIRRPRSMGISFLVDTEVSNCNVVITGGRYWPIECFVSDSQQCRRIWVRVPVSAQIPISWAGLNSNSRFKVELKPSEIHHLPPLDLEMHVRFRRPPAELGSFGGGVRLVTLTLVNCSRAPKNQIDRFALFQSRFIVESARESVFPFLPLPSIKRDADYEQRSLALLYRSNPSFSHGHGCAGSWDFEPSAGAEFRKAARVIAEPFPIHQVPPVTANLHYPATYYAGDADKTPTSHPRAGRQLRILMAPLARGEKGWLEPLEEVAELYKSWIRSREKDALGLDEVHLAAAKDHIKVAEDCHRRIIAGIQLLKEDPDAARAFSLANKAILLQQLAGRRKIRMADYAQRNDKWSWPDFKEPHIEQDDAANDDDKCAWRPFQIAFLLMSLPGLWDGEHPDRDIADLIWFPTGGGKTEAYLGAAAFHMLGRRLQAPEESGTAVLMRYTLRLLTAQQFQRASGLICALETLRRGNEDDLGSEPFKIGIWVGGDTTPNTRPQSVRAYEAAKAEGEAKYKHVVFRCPWCAAQMGPIAVQNGRRTNRSLQGLRAFGSGEDKTVVLFCPDRSCAFHEKLPLYVVDEDVYAEKPSLVIGTVDKFAMLAWRPQARSIFGIDDKGRHEVSPPGLIIQDELHLITGPLGSMVGLYEGLVDSLCTQRLAKAVVRPKLIASTATTRASTSQIRDLYDRKKTFLFPPPGLDAGDSFFATYDREDNGKIKPGRMYVGVLARSYGSGLTVNVRVLSALMAAAALIDEKERNPWQTLLVFYNSLRELGAGLSLYSHDIPERLMNLSWRWATGMNGARFLHEDRILELTGRLSNSDIPKALQALERDFLPPDQRDAIDACLASNIIEVGVDVPRLGLMAVSGQPKNTAQYIQATGRVGRNKPGLVVMIYDNKKARDLSHYEHFRDYHGRLYAEVEPASVTPFTTQVLERALHGVFVAWVRNKLPLARQSDPQQFQQAQGEMRASFEEFCDFYRSRIRNLFAADDAARDEALDVFEKALDLRKGEWLAWTRGGGAQQCAVQWENSDIVSDESGDMPLLRRYGEACKIAWKFSTWETPTSMRGVDAECAADIVQQIPD
jgi:hypothetical protein